MFSTSSSPLVADGLCIAQLGGQGNGAIVAYDLATGAEKWKWTGDGTAYASPALMTVDGLKVVVAETDKRLVAVGLADGKLLWEAPFDPGRGPGRYNSVTPGHRRPDPDLRRPAPRHDRREVREARRQTGRQGTLDQPGRHAAIQHAGLEERPAVRHVRPRYALLRQRPDRQDGLDGGRPLAGNRGYGSVVDAGAVLFALYARRGTHRLRAQRQGVQGDSPSTRWPTAEPTAIRSSPATACS